jgi:hypothetical protein
MSGGLMLGVIAALIGFSASSLVNYNFGDSEPLLMLLSVVALTFVASAGFEPRSAQRAPEGAVMESMISPRPATPSVAAISRSIPNQGA